MADAAEAAIEIAKRLYAHWYSSHPFCPPVPPLLPLCQRFQMGEFGTNSKWNNHKVQYNTGSKKRYKA